MLIFQSVLTSYFGVLLSFSLCFGDTFATVILLSFFVNYDSALLLPPFFMGAVIDITCLSCTRVINRIQLTQNYSELTTLGKVRNIY